MFLPDEEILLDPKEWQPAIASDLENLVIEDPTTFDIDRIKNQDSEGFQRIIKKTMELIQLGHEREAVILRHYRELLGLFSQSYWRRRGYLDEELALDKDGHVCAVRISPVHFAAAKPHLKRLIGCWATTDESFCSPDGRPTYQLEEIEKLNTMSDAEQMEFFNSKLH